MHQCTSKTNATAYLRGVMTILPRVLTVLPTSNVQPPDAHDVVTAGCVAELVDGNHRSSNGLCGAFLSMISKSENPAAYHRASHFAGKLKLSHTKDVVLASGIGHGSLSRADLVWIAQVAIWPEMASV